MNQAMLLALGGAVGLTILVLNRFLSKRETAEDVVHRVVVGAIEHAVAEASSRWADWEFAR
jgi:hypothetical protein